MSSLFVEPISSEEALREGATAEDIAIVARFTSEHRRREVLAWRSIVRRELGNDCTIGYDEWGAPIVDLPNTHIGISHCRDLVAVIISDAPCAIDIEERGRNFERVSERYMTESERALSADTDWLAKVWCAKEAIYKYYRKGGVDIRRDIKVLGYNAESESLQVTIFDTRLEVKIDSRGDYIVATID